MRRCILVKSEGRHLGSKYLDSSLLLSTSFLPAEAILLHVLHSGLMSLVLTDNWLFDLFNRDLHRANYIQDTLVWPEFFSIFLSFIGSTKMLCHHALDRTWTVYRVRHLYKITLFPIEPPFSFTKRIEPTSIVRTVYVDIYLCI